MKSTAAVVVIGGGVIGASVAYHLARKGVGDIVIIDAAPRPGSGSTGKATGGYRAQFATDINVRLSLLSLGKLLAFEDDTGVDPGYSPVGYLWIASSDRELEWLHAAGEVQASAGLEGARMLSPDDVSRLNPAVRMDGIRGGAFCQSDGYIRPLEILRGYLEAGARHRVELRWETECLGFELRRNRIARVLTSRGAIEAASVVNAAGPWAASVAAMAGVDLPVSALRRQAAITEPTGAIPASMPMTIFLDNGFHLRARDGRALLCWPTAGARDDPFNLDVEEDWLAECERMMRTRVPVLSGISLDRPACYAGLYEMSPDKHPILGYASECPNMFLVNGSSGHGVMHSPALGAIAADMICGDKPEIDVRSLRPSRFAEGATIPNTDLL